MLVCHWRSTGVFQCEEILEDRLKGMVLPKLSDALLQRKINSESEMSEKLWEVKQVPSGLLVLKSSVVEVFAAQIQPKVASAVVRKLNQCAPLSSLHHVKRVRKVSREDGVELSIILCLVPSGSHEWSSSKVPPEVSAIVDEHELVPFVQQVPQYEACSRDEWEDQCRCWPTSYHPNAVKFHQVVSFDDEQVKDICRLMRVAIRQAKIAAKSGQLPNGAVIADPSGGLVVSTGHDETGGWMNAECGVELGKGQVDGYRYTGVNAEHQSSSERIHSWHPLRHAVMVAIERSAEKNKAEKDDYNVCNEESSRVSAKQPRIDERVGSIQRTSSAGSGNYLCTGFDAYVTREPCSMCAMALLHQRVHRIFYGIPNTKIGALGGFHRLHGMQGLNHHYLVFQVSLCEEDIME